MERSEGEAADLAGRTGKRPGCVCCCLMALYFLRAGIGYALSGEEAVLQERFGLRTGVLILGVVWGLWHLPCDFFYYVTPEKGLIMTATQIITCVSLGIFFAWAYRKTGNLWVPVILHYMNNNLAPLIANTYSADLFQDQEITWGMLPGAVLMNGLIFGFFLLSKEFREKKE